MEKNELQILIGRLNSGKRISLGSRVLTIDEKGVLANYIENNIDDYCNEEFQDDEDVLYDAIEPVDARDGDWMFDDEDNAERHSIW